MQTDLTPENIKEFLSVELPEMMETNPEVRRLVLNIVKDRFADKERTDDRFDRILDELKRDREENFQKWKDQQWKWEAQELKWEAQERKWEKNQETIDGVLFEIKRMNRKHESTLGALGARWGLNSEAAFREGLRSVLEESFGVRVERYLDFDHEGVVFGRPDQVELDLIIRNGTLIICEIKSSISKSDLYAFWRKKVFYEDKHRRKADRSLVISPMVDARAKEVALELMIEVFGYPEDVTF